MELFGFKDHDIDSEPQLQFKTRETVNANVQVNNTSANRTVKPKTPCVRDDKGKDLGSLGYAVAEPIDWMRVQLPKKQDLFQEFYRRIHNYM